MRKSHNWTILLDGEKEINSLQKGKSMKKVSGKATAKHTAAKVAAKAAANSAVNDAAVTEVKEEVMKKNEVKPEVTVQYRHYEADMEAVIQRVKEDVEVRGNRGVEIEKMQIYVKPEDFAAYYVINDGIVGKVNLF